MYERGLWVLAAVETDQGHLLVAWWLHNSCSSDSAHELYECERRVGTGGAEKRSVMGGGAMALYSGRARLEGASFVFVFRSRWGSGGRPGPWPSGHSPERKASRGSAGW